MLKVTSNEEEFLFKMSVRVKVCLNEIFKDYRKEALVYVDPNCKHVCDFEKHIHQLFNIQFGIYLTIGGSLLPSNEIVNVIHSGDIITVNRFDKKIDSGLEVPLIENDNDLQQTVEIETDEQSNDLSKRGKRIRKRKRKQVPGNDVEVPDASKTETVDKVNPIVKPKKLLKESQKLFTELSLTNHVRSQSEKTPSHIRFTNDIPDTSDTKTSSKSSASSNHLDGLQARVIRPVTVLIDAGAPHTTQVSSKSNCETTQECERSITSLKDVANDSNFAEVAASINFEEIIKNMDKSSEFVTLKEEPKTYDVLAFKMLKIGKNYEPQLSQWIIAMVKDVEDVNITMSILAGQDETACPDGKLSMDICEGDETESSDMITLQRTDMLNVKVFYN